MNYPYKYLLFGEYDDSYSFESFINHYCDYNDLIQDYDCFVSDGYKCSIYRILKFDNFDL